MLTTGHDAGRAASEGPALGDVVDALSRDGPVDLRRYCDAKGVPSIALLRAAIDSTVVQVRFQETELGIKLPGPKSSAPRSDEEDGALPGLTRDAEGRLRLEGMLRVNGTKVRATCCFDAATFRGRGCVERVR